MKPINVLLKNSISALLILIAANIVLHSLKPTILAHSKYILVFSLIIIAIVIVNDLYLELIKSLWIKIVLLLLSLTLLFVFDISMWPTTKKDLFEFTIIYFVVFLFVFICWLDRAKNNNYNTYNYLDDDSPLEKVEDDMLNRTEFCSNIFNNMISNKSQNQRIALTGEWGSGKTTCLNFISKIAKQHGYPVVFFSSWQFENREEAWQGFLSAIDDGCAEWKGMKLGPIRKNKAYIFLFRLLQNGLNIVLNNNSIGFIFNEVFNAKTEVDSKTLKSKASSIIMNFLNEKKLFILIDDLDRAQAVVVYRFFISITDIIDFPGCVFICAYDESAVISILKNNGIEKVDEYLDKIFHNRIELPELTNNFKILMQNSLLNYPNVRREIIMEINKILPDNPRVLKYYLRKINTLHILLNRFSDEDIKWPVIYASELVKIKYPEESRTLEVHSIFFEYLSSNLLRELNNEKINELKSNLINICHNSDDDFWLTLDTIRSLSWGLNQDTIRYHWRALSHPEILTWKEYYEWKENSKISILNRLIDPKINIEIRREFLIGLIRERERYLSLEADVFPQIKRERLLNKAIILTNEAMLYVSQPQLHKGPNPVFDETVVKIWFDNLLKWSHFNNLYYQEIRNIEQLTTIILTRQSLDIVDLVLPYFNDSHYTLDSTSINLRKMLRNLYENELAQQTITKLKDANSISNLWGHNKHWETKRLFMTPTGAFYNSLNLGNLKEHLNQSNNDYVVQENVYQILRLLLYYGLDLNNSDALEILKNDMYREMYWKAATCRNLNQRSLGDLLSKRKILQEKLAKEDIMPLPRWLLNNDDLMLLYEKRILHNNCY